MCRFFSNTSKQISASCTQSKLGERVNADGDCRAMHKRATKHCSIHLATQICQKNRYTTTEIRRKKLKTRTYEKMIQTRRLPSRRLSRHFLAQKMKIWVCKVIRIAAVRVWMSVDVQTFPGHGSSGAVSRPGAAARRGIIRGLVPSSYNKFGTRPCSL